jgi:O-acetylhomoserine (thiol)-lyase
VYYPGLPSHPQHALARALFSGFGALLSFELDPALDCFEFLNRLSNVVLSSNLGDNRTLAIPVAQTIYWEMGPERRASMGIAESLIRISVGIEDRDDLIADFAQALAD